MAARTATAALPLPEATPTLVAPPEWRAIDFLSDLHLSAHTPRTFEAWAGHLRATTADAVFILGDLFEAWVGDELARSGFEARCVEVLAEAAGRRTVGFMAGNRDFLVGDALLEAAGVKRLQDPMLIVAFGSGVLLSHGDALCLDDVSYQRFRRLVRLPGVQRSFLGLPLSWRRALGRAARRRSESTRTPTRRRFIDVDPTASSDWLEAAGVRVLVHGHTHAPASHDIAGGMRHVLSDWDMEDAASPRAEVLRWTADGFARIAPEHRSEETLRP